MKFGLFFLSFSVALISCRTRLNDCDFILSAKELMNHIRSKNITGIENMMAFKDPTYEEEGGVWDRVIEASNKYLDTISSLDNLIKRHNENSFI